MKTFLSICKTILLFIGFVVLLLGLILLLGWLAIRFIGLIGVPVLRYVAGLICLAVIGWLIRWLGKQLLPRILNLP